MDTPHTLSDDLDALTEALGDPVLDLEAVLCVLTDDLTAAVPSYLGLSMSLQIDDNTPVTLTSSTALSLAEARASLSLPLVPQGLPRPGGNVVFYASADLAFSDLADDARWMFTLSGQAVMDDHLPPITPTARAGFGGLSECSEINQAIGVLIAMGYSAPEAHIELQRRALRDQRTGLDTAHDLLTTVSAKPAVAQ